MATFPIKGLPPIPTDQDSLNFTITSAFGQNETSATPFSVNTWQELIASTEENWAGFTFYSSAQYGGIISFAVGSAGNEVKIADLRRFSLASTQEFHIPIPVAAGSRISLHYHNDANSSRTIQGFIIPQLTSDVAMNPPYTRLDCGPFELAQGTWGNGTQVDTGGVEHVWGAWTELTQPTYTDNVLDGSSIPYQYKWLGLCFRFNGGTVSKNLVWELAYGSAGSETKIIEGAGLWKQGWVGEFPYAQTTWIKWDRPAGDRISVRTKSTELDPSRRLSWFYLLGLL